MQSWLCPVLRVVLVSVLWWVGVAKGLAGHGVGLGTTIVFDTETPGDFPLVRGGQAVPLVMSETDWARVLRAGRDLQADIERVTGARPAVTTNAVPQAHAAVIIGTLGKSALIDDLAKSWRGVSQNHH